MIDVIVAILLPTLTRTSARTSPAPSKLWRTWWALHAYRFAVNFTISCTLSCRGERTSTQLTPLAGMSGRRKYAVLTWAYCRRWSCVSAHRIIGGSVYYSTFRHTNRTTLHHFTAPPPQHPSPKTPRFKARKPRHLQRLQDDSDFDSQARQYLYSSTTF
jgi:hypothetical protein